MEIRDRIAEIDIIKALAIFLVLVGHSNILPQTGKGSGEWFIALFHVAVFYIASGYVYKDKYSDSLNSVKLFLIKKLKNLWLPFVLINGSLYALEVILHAHRWTGRQVVSDMTGILLVCRTADYAAPSWFVISIFYISAVYVLSSFLLKKLFGNRRGAVIFGQFLLSAAFLGGGFAYREELAYKVLWVLFGYCQFFIGTLMHCLSENYKLMAKIRKMQGGGSGRYAAC